MKTKLPLIGLSFSFLLFFHSFSIFSDAANEPLQQCQTQNTFDDNTNVTFYGDSLGANIEATGYGYFGWEFYLGVHKPSVNWKVQNLASAASSSTIIPGGSSTYDIYQRLNNCGKPLNRPYFKTADNIALEVGLSDYIQNVAVLMYMPWKVVDVDRRVTHNTRVLVRMLRNPLRNKKVLLMGNFPTIAKSPTLGNWPEYFVPFKHLPTGQVSSDAESIKQKRQNEAWDNALKIYLESVATSLITSFFSPFISWAVSGWSSLNDLQQMAFEAESLASSLNWYEKWLHDNYQNPITHAVSLGLLFHQHALEQMANEENQYQVTYQYAPGATVQYTAGGVTFLPLYPVFLRHSDAALGHLHVANPELYSDIINLNHFGYYLWSGLMANKFTEMNWNNLPEPTDYDGELCRTWNCGKTKNPPVGNTIQETIEPEPVVVEPLPIEWLILICYFTGKCW